jgi:hypothetical protein
MASFCEARVGVNEKSSLQFLNLFASVFPRATVVTCAEYLIWK